MWSWDACFIGVGLSWVSVQRAITEMDTLLAAQWRNEMLPHIVFSAFELLSQGYAESLLVVLRFPGSTVSPDRTHRVCRPRETGVG